MSLKDVKVNFLVDIAIDLFMCRSVQEVTIRDIAVSAQVGEATIYRYFGSKQNLVIQAAMKIQNIVSSYFFKIDEGNNGYEKLAIFYQSYLDIYNDHPNFYKFLEEFDSFISTDTADTNNYEAVIEQYKTFYMKSYQIGLKDGSLKKQKDIDSFYFSTTHAILELCKKLAYKRAVLKQDKGDGKEKEIQCLIDIILLSLNNL